MKKLKSILMALFLIAWVAGCSLPWSVSAPQPDPTAEALYEEGARYFAEKRYARAIDVLTKLRTEYPFSPQLIDAELKIADAYYLNQQYAEAINSFKEFQSMHATNEHIPFVVYRLGQAHLDQFTSIERDQKNTEIAKGYFENVITNYSKSAYAAPAREQLAKAVGYLAEHEFSIASFYLQQEKYPAARERFEEIVRKYRGTPVAARSLFFLGESYRREKNNVKAMLAYEALLQHYPESKFAPEAKAYLAQLEKDKQDPLAMLLMRDRRPVATGAGTVQETAVNEKLKPIDNLTAKTEVVYEEPGDEKGIFRRVAEKLNPFSSSDNGKKTPESPTEALAKKKTSEKESSPGAVASMWSSINPFGGQKTPEVNNAQASAGGAKSPTETAANTQLVNQIDESLKQKGIDSATQTASLKPPPAAMPKVETPPPQTMDTAKLLGDIDANLKKSGKNVETVPAPPEAHPAFKDPATAEAIATAAKAKTPEPQPDGASAGLLSSIDQKLKSQGLEPSRFQPPPTAEQLQAAARQEPARKVELEPKLATEKGPLFLTPGEIPTQGKANAPQAVADVEKKAGSPEKQQTPADREFPRTLVKGPTSPQPAVAEQRRPAPPGQEDESKGAFDQLRSDMENMGKALNPFRW
jgi:outer membrane protein assembly factor BamD